MTRPTSTAARLARYGFLDAERATALLGALPVTDEAPLLDALSRAADPDLALRQLHRLVELEGPDPLVNPRRLLAVLGASSALGDHLVATPGEWRTLSTVDPPLSTVEADRSTVEADRSAVEAGRSAVEDRWDAQLAGATDVTTLRRAYRRCLLWIAAADLTGARDVEQTMADLAALADATLRAAWRLAAPPGPAPRLAVVAMGKCGGRELNYVSDVDVIFVAAGDEDLAGATTLATRLIELCAQVAWPVDAALRPEGNRGPLVRTLASHAAYYQKWARTWEFQALLKARPAAGDAELARQWLAAVDPLIWHAAERPEAVEDVRAMRRRIIDSVPPAERDREIKRGPGGLRDIEFAVQLLQLVHGRGDEALRSPSTLEALRQLVAGGYVGRADGEALVEAYRFLRTVEHRLQLQRLRRTHTVPVDPAGLRWLAHALGYRSDARRDAVAAFRSDWVSYAGQVRRLHAKLLYRPLLEAVAKVPAESLRLTPDAARARLQTLGFADPAGALRHIQALTGGVSRTAAIQHTLLPVLLEEYAEAPEPDRGLLAYRQVSERLGATPWYLRLLRDEGPVALRLARLLGLSRYVADLLVRDPEALRLLATDSELAPRSRDTLLTGFDAAAARYPDPEEAITAVRALRRRELFRVAAGDLLGAGGLGDVAVVGQALADVTDATLAAALAAAQRATGGAGAPFAVVAMGRLGGYEMSYPSDADVLFIAEDPGSGQAVAEELRRLLGIPAPDPPLGVDADLRPEGRQGPLVRSLAAYRQYYSRWAHVWEAQALLRARYICGDPELGERFLSLVDGLRYPPGGLSREQVVEIRRIKARVDSERLPRRADPLTHTKLGRGGLSDVEWTIQLIQLQHAHAVPGLRTPRTVDALVAARDAGLVTPADATALEAAWRLASRVRNALMLVRGKPSDQLPRHGTELAGVVAALGAGDPGGFVDDYLRTARHARAAVDRLF